MTRNNQNQRGASAVEFALILPLLVTLLLGIVEFGYLFNQQISLTQAAREGARQHAIHHGETGFVLEDKIKFAAPALAGVTVDPVVPCTTGETARVVLRMEYHSLTGWIKFALPTELVGLGAMRCGG